MKNLNLPEISMEAISYQGRSMLLFDLVSAVESLRATVPSTALVDTPASQVQPRLDQLGLTALISKRTGMKVVFLCEDTYDCWAEPPLLDANNPFFRQLKGDGLFDNRRPILERHQRALRLAQDTRSWVDLKEGRVGGVFSSLYNRIFLGKSLLLDQNFTSEEVAAVILHELGHLFSYFETLAYTTTSNMVITTAVEALQGMDDKSHRLKLLSQSASVFNAKLPPEIIDEEGADVIKVLLLQTIEQAEQNRVREMAANKETRYNHRSIEFMADQFAVRSGAAVALATAQHKMAKLNVPDYGKSRASFFAVQATRMALLAASFAIPGVGVVIGPTLLALGVMFLSAQAEEDDGRSDPRERLAQISRDIIQLLKNPQLDKQSRHQLSADLEAISVLREEVTENHGIVRFLYRNVLPSGRRQAKARELQKGIEELVNNNLFVHASRLRSA